MQLTKTEEDLMNYLWKLEKAFRKDLLDAYQNQNQQQQRLQHV